MLKKIILVGFLALAVLGTRVFAGQNGSTSGSNGNGSGSNGNGSGSNGNGSGSGSNGNGASEVKGKPVILLHDRHGHCTPHRVGCTHTGGGVIDVTQPTPDTVVILMSGVVVAHPCPLKESSASMNFDLNQCLEIAFDDPTVCRPVKLTVESQVVGLLRSHVHGKCGTASVGPACATITGHDTALANVCIEPHSVGGGENLSINDRPCPVTVPVTVGKLHLNQTFAISACQGKCGLPCKGPSAEFADGALDPLWISYKEPFRGAAKKTFGFQVTIRVAE